MNWRAADSVKVLLAEVNGLFPGRDKRTDGVVSGYPGSVSSHQVNSAGVVCAVDITVGDYPNGITPTQGAALAEAIRHELKVAPRGIYAYVIYDRRMARSTHDWEWEPYTGTSPHTDHIHVSVDWDIPEGGAPSGECPYDMTDTWNLRGPSMVATTLPTSRPVTQDWNQDFEWLNGVHYPNGFYSSIGWLGHNGIDFGCYEGDPVEAVCDGVIEFVGPGNNHWLLSGGGNAILLRNDSLGVMFEYLHLSRFEVSQGQSVSRGQVIARSGNTGTSTAPHLHIGAIPINGVDVNNGYRGRIDPTPYLYGSMNPDYAGSGISPAGTITPLEEDVANTDISLQDNTQKVLRDNALVKGGRSIAGALTQLIDSTDIIGARDLKQLEELADLKTLLGQLVKSTTANQSTYYLKGDKKPEVYALDVASGKLRHVDSAEFDVVTSIGIFKTVPQAKVDALVGGK
jgi:hypothetical protein